MNRSPLIRLYADEACADLFAGGGGTSTGIEMALGHSPDVAINHDREALAMHEVNHPETEHLRGDVFHYDPDAIARGRRFAFAWFSPDCTHHSKAKGGVPFRDKRRSLRIRGLAWVMVRWAESAAKPRVMFMENVEEWWDWGPLLETSPGQWVADPARKGDYRKRIMRRFERAGYTWEMRKLRASDFGAPTTRVRLFLILRCDGRPIVWPEPTHGPRKAPSVITRVLGSGDYQTAADHIDFSLPVPSIFLTPAEARAWGRALGMAAPRRPLATATQRRIARGVVRYVIDAADPFIVPIGADTITTPYIVPPRGMRQDDGMVDSVATPLRTIKACDGHVFGLVAPVLSRFNSERSEGSVRGQSVREPITTLDTSNRFGLVAAFLAKHNGGHEATGQSVNRPVDTIVCRENKALVMSRLLRVPGVEGLSRAREARAFLVKFFGTGVARSLRNPADTITTRDRVGLVVVTIAGEDYVLVDIGMRMLTPRELFLLQGFPSRYVIDRGVIDGKAVRFTKGTQTRLVGNSVPPQLAAALIGANLMREAVA